MPTFAQNPSLLADLFWIEAFVGVLGVVVISVLFRLVEEGNESWISWACSLATIGYVILAVGYTLSLAKLSGIAIGLRQMDESIKAELTDIRKGSIDLLGL